ncbi:MAG: Gfo/Idh/MocA family oxidoreductase [Candidatus Dormiibacterota bacterium]
MPEPVRVALAGTGAIAHAHARAIVATPGLELAGVFDRDHARAEAFAHTYGAPRCYPTWQALLEDDAAGCVAVLVPPDAHEELTLAALAAGRDVMCEKPLARTVADCDRMLAAAREAGRVLLPGHNRVYEPGIERMGEIVHGGGLGHVYLVQSNGLEPPSLLDRVPWLRSEVSLGGVLIGQAVHAAYVLRWLVGPIAGVQAARVRDNTVEMTREDTAVVTLQFESGAVGALSSTFAVARGPLDHEIVLFGSEGYLRTTRRDGTERLFGVVPSICGDEELHELPLPARASWAGLWPDYARALRRESAPRQTAEDGRAAVAVIEAAYRSMAEQRTVRPAP